MQNIVEAPAIARVTVREAPSGPELATAIPVPVEGSESAPSRKSHGERTLRPNAQMISRQGNHVFRSRVDRRGAPARGR